MSTLQFSFSIENLKNFVDLSSILMVIGGTLAVVVACYPKQIRSLPKHFKIMLHSNTFDPQVYVDQLTELAQIARKNGLLALEETVSYTHLDVYKRQSRKRPILRRRMP